MSKPEQSAPELQAGTIEQALANGRQLLGSRPDMALAQALAILKRDNRNPDAYRLAAAGHRALGEKDSAERAELAAIRHSQQVPELLAAAKALDENQPGEASRLAAEHLRAKPDDLAAITLSAESALAFGLADQAEQLLKPVLERAPAFLAAKSLLISALMRQDKLLESRSLAEEMLVLRPNDEVTLRLLARIHGDLGDLGAAARIYESLLKTADRSTDLWMLYGDTLRFLGRHVDSRLAYKRALALDSCIGQAWWALANLDPKAVTKNEIGEMEQALDRLSPEQTMNLHFALGLALDAKQQHSEAFRHFEAGNRLRRDMQPYDPIETHAQVDRHIGALRGAAIARLNARSDAPAPIFIVGMPRSGSTLVERIIGRHSQIDALGELPVVPHIVEGLMRQDTAIPVEERIAQLPPVGLSKLAQRYRDRAAERGSGAAYFTDKLHMNWRHLPLILRMLPEARIIDVRRSALDCCWSNYKLLARGHPAAADLADLGRYFADYVRLMDHIDTIAPGRIHRLHYEALVDDLEGETRKVLDYVGLPFEPGILDFHLSDQPVATASSEQVRQPLNREGIGAWRPYAEWLGPLREALGPLVDS
jgi:tetratricopeptide (TPR) repeat protein